MKKLRMAAITAAAALLLSGCASGGGAGGGDAESVDIGFINIFTGAASAIGKSAREGVQLAVEQINADGGIDGRQINLVEEDAGSTPATALTGIKRLISEEPDFIIGTPLSAQAIAIAPSIAAAEIPTLIYAGANGAIAEGRPWVFRMIPNQITEAGNAVAYAVEEQGFEKVGVIYESTDFGKGGADQIAAALEQRDITPVAVETVDVDATSVDAQVTKMKSAGAEAVFVWASGTPSTLTIKAAHNLGLDAELITSGAAANANVLQTLTPDEIAPIRASLVSTVADTSQPQIEDFVNAYQEAYGYVPDQNAAAYYDSVFLAAEAISAAGTEDAAALRDAVQSIEGYVGVSNVYTYDDDGECCTRGAVVSFDENRLPVIEVVLG